MKKALVTIITAFILLALTPVELSASTAINKTRGTKYSMFDSSMEVLTQGETVPFIEVTYFVNGSITTKQITGEMQPRFWEGVLKFVIQFVIDETIEAGIAYIDSYRTPSDVITQWVVDNSKSKDYVIKSYEIIYDDGCCKPEFPNNPFCRIKL